MTAHRRRTLVLACGAALCLAGMVLLLTTPGEAAVVVGADGSVQVSGGGQACGFPATGQTTAYTADKHGNPGAVVQDDGTVQAGETLRYKDNGDGTITDKVTGLMWEKKSYDQGLHDYHRIFPWSYDVFETIWDWLDDVNAEGGKGFARHHDWRIPNVKELQSIIDYQNFKPAIASAFNTNCVPNVTVFTGSCIGSATDDWSSSTTAQNSGFAWVVDFRYGDGWSDDKHFPHPVRAVRGGCALGPN